ETRRAMPPVAAHIILRGFTHVLVGALILLFPPQVLAQDANLVNDAIRQGAALIQKGNYAGALPLIQKAKMLAPGAYGPNTKDTAIILHQIAFLFDAAGQYDEAVALYQRSLKIKKVRLAADDPSIVLTLTDLGLVHQSLAH